MECFMQNCCPAVPLLASVLEFNSVQLEFTETLGEVSFRRYRTLYPTTLAFTGLQSIVRLEEVLLQTFKSVGALK